MGGCNWLVVLNFSPQELKVEFWILKNGQVGCVWTYFFWKHEVLQKEAPNVKTDIYIYIYTYLKIHINPSNYHHNILLVFPTSMFKIHYHPITFWYCCWFRNPKQPPWNVSSNLSKQWDFNNYRSLNWFFRRISGCHQRFWSIQPRRWRTMAVFEVPLPLWPPQLSGNAPCSLPNLATSLEVRCQDLRRVFWRLVKSTTKNYIL